MDIKGTWTDRYRYPVVQSQTEKDMYGHKRFTDRYNGYADIV